jgi:hypothetical protein
MRQNGATGAVFRRLKRLEISIPPFVLLIFCHFCHFGTEIA